MCLKSSRRQDKKYVSYLESRTFTTKTLVHLLMSVGLNVTKLNVKKNEMVPRFRDTKVMFGMKLMGMLVKQKVKIIS